MKSLLDKIKNKFKYATLGWLDGLKKDHSIQIQWGIATLVILFSFLFPLTKQEWMIVLLLCFLVIAFEYMNSALEALVDLVSPNYHPFAKKCKDYAAASVLMISMVAFIIALIIYVPYIKEMLGGIL